MGSTMRHVASVSEGTLLAWTDLDPEGVRIFRTLHESSGGRLQAFRMAPAELSHSTLRISGQKSKALEEELGREGPLEDLLLEMKKRLVWREQESQLQPEIYAVNAGALELSPENVPSSSRAAPGNGPRG